MITCSKNERGLVSPVGTNQATTMEIVRAQTNTSLAFEDLLSIKYPHRSRTPPDIDSHISIFPENINENSKSIPTINALQRIIFRK